MSKLDEFNAAAAHLRTVKDWCGEFTGRNNLSNDKACLRFQLHEGRLFISAGHGYYGSSSFYSIDDHKGFKEALTDALNSDGMKFLIADAMEKQATKEFFRAKLAAKAEAEAALKEVS